MRNRKRNDADELIYRTEGDSQRMNLRLPGGGMGKGIVRESGIDMDTLLYLTWRTSKDPLDSTGDSAQYSVITLWSPGGKDGRRDS